MEPPDRTPLPPEYLGFSEPPLPAEDITPFERFVNLLVAGVLVGLGLYVLFVPI